MKSLALGLAALALLSPSSEVWASVCDPVVQWMWDGLTEAPDYPRPRHVFVLQLTDDDGDGRITVEDVPDVVFLHGSGGGRDQLTALDGRTGASHFTIGDPLLQGDSLAGGDIDGDGVVELVAINTNRNQLVAFEHDGTLKWHSTSLPDLWFSNDTVGIADLDQDGSPEIYSGPAVFNADGTLSWLDDSTPGGIVRGAQAVDLVASNPGLEILYGNTLYAADGTVLWTKPALPYGWTAVADFDGDEVPEIILVGPDAVAPSDISELYLLDNLGNPLGPPYVLTLPRVRSTPPFRPTVADIDGDGLPEVMAISGSEILALEWSGGAFSVKWRQPVVESGFPYATAFDFDGDGAAEVVYRDDNDWFIFDGSSGVVLYAESSPSLSGKEPVIADVDNDCKTEVLVLASGGRSGSVTCYECNREGTLARAIWNQTGYHVTNVEDDGRIPRYEEPSWIVRNDWQAQAFTDPRVPPGDLGNGLSAVKAGPAVILSWTGVAGADTYSLHRGTDKGIWPLPPFRPGLTGTTESLPDVAGPPDRYYYRLAGVTCAAIEGP